MSLLTEIEYKDVVICGDGNRKMALFTYVFAQIECKNVVIYGDTAHSFRSQNTQMSLFTDMENKNVVICGDVKRNMPLFTYVFAQMECENVVIYGDTAHSFRSQNTQMSLFTKMENKNVVICGDVKRNMPLFTYVFAQRECENLVIYGDTAHSFRSQNFANAVIDGDGIQKCRYLRRCATKNAIIYVCYSADGVRKSRYLRRYSTFFLEPKYINVVIDRDAIQKCPYLLRWEPKNGIIYVCFCADGVRKCRYVRR